MLDIAVVIWHYSRNSMSTCRYNESEITVYIRFNTILTICNRNFIQAEGALKQFYRTGNKRIQGSREIQSYIIDVPADLINPGSGTEMPTEACNLAEE